MENSTETGSVSCKIERGVASIQFFHRSHNSLPSNLLAGLAEAIDEAGRNREVIAIILSAAGDRTFCAGASFDELASISNFQEAQGFFSGFGRVINSMRRCPKFIIGRIHGKAVGGGVGLAAATDFCLATKFASIRLSELAVGFGPFVIGPAVERKVGLAAFSQLAASPDDWQTADWAREKGLFQQVFPTIDELDAAIFQLAEKWRGYSPEAMQLLKEIFWKGTENWESLLDERAAISGRLALSDFSKQAIAAFKAR